MESLNELRLQAGIPIDPSIEKTKQITEARETPKMRSELAGKDKKSLKSQARGIQRAMEHVKQAIAVLEKIPATDYRGEIPHFIGELEDLLDGESAGGMSAYYDSISDEGTNFGKEPEPEEEMPDMEPEMDMGDEEMPPDEEMPEMEPDMEMPADDESAYESDDDDFLKNLSDVDKDHLKTAIATLRMISGGSMIKETMERISKITGKTLEEAMHYYDVDYDNFKPSDKPVNVSDGASNDEQVMSTMKDPKQEGPEQTRTMDQQDNSEQDKSGDDLSTTVKVPNGIKQSLKSEIEAARKEAKKQDSRNSEAANFYGDLANAFEELLGHLEKGTRYDIKQAQVFAQSLMGPMLHKIPNKVWKFIVNGGEPVSLKGYMKPVDSKYPMTGPRNTLK